MVGMVERTNSDSSDRALRRILLLIRTFRLSHALFVDIGVLSVRTALLWCLNLARKGGEQVSLKRTRSKGGSED